MSQRFHGTMKPPAPRDRLDFRRVQRAAPSRIERILWTCLSDRRFHDLKFRRQHGVGPYVADFVCVEAMLIVEADGPHHAQADQAAHDAARDRYLAAEGYLVVRLPQDEILTAVELSLARVERALAERRR
jgi:very-short-patch-repair endonuclease